MKWLLIFTGILITGTAGAQVQIGLFGGVANYQGDLSARPYQAGKGVMGMTVSYAFTNRISIRAGLSFARVSAADSLNKMEDFRMRNLSFQSPITEFHLAAQFYTFDMEVKNWSPYVFAGLAVYRFNPFTHDAAGNKIFLQPLGTEGQGLPGYPENNKYSLTQLAVPFGGGIRFSLTDQIGVSVEAGLRKLFTDFLDDVSGQYADASELLAGNGQRSVDISYRTDELRDGNSTYPARGEQRGSPKYKDYYYFTGVQLAFLLTGGEGGNRRGSRRYGCPGLF